ncbi:MAG: 1-deoxy-D-xylulose-5-phosphate reductoisomerase [Candidatus Cloacimonetes bacterium HGW-Cloacimonetes-1]|nr:MAG: 1-deoxy-D-xylulose-5-phosphate reductoisomerase [Candidatus Cloacimonetes bacterium HGW-Cloacimonetes-1]
MVSKKIALLGATGSIGSSTIDVVREQNPHYAIALASAHTDFKKLFELAQEFRIPYLVLTGIGEDGLRERLRNDCPAPHLYFGEDELIRLLSDLDYDIALNAITGSAGLRSTLSVLERGIDLALANKESLVMSGHLVQALIAQHGSRILPVDSEHSAIFQAIGQHPGSELRTLHITASGGPFRSLPIENFAQITKEQALKHPNWDMGTKVTLDSATMFNKALEVMEAHWLFGMPFDQISAVIHPQSVIHSMVEFVDGSILAQMSNPDMKLPILYALSYPHRYPSQAVQTDLLKLSPLTFLPIDPARFPMFYLGIEVGRRGGILPTVMNAANEAALLLFMQDRIRFVDIFRVVAEAVEKTANIANPDLETILQVNRNIYHGLSAKPSF